MPDARRKPAIAKRLKMDAFKTIRCRGSWMATIRGQLQALPHRWQKRQVDYNYGQCRECGFTVPIAYIEIDKIYEAAAVEHDRPTELT